MLQSQKNSIYIQYFIISKFLDILINFIINLDETNGKNKVLSFFNKLPDNLNTLI